MNVTTKHGTLKTGKRLAALGVALLLAAGLTACSGGANDGKAGPSASASESASASASAPAPSASAGASATAPPAGSGPSDPEADAALLKAFEEQAHSDMSAAELSGVLDDKLKQAQPETGDALVRTMLDYYDRSLPGIQAKFEPQNVQEALRKLDWPPTDDGIGKIGDEQVRTLVQEAVSGGYKLETAEGMFFPVVDYGKLKRADAHVTASMKDYIALLAVESDQKSASDGGLVIERSEVAARAAQAEAYVAKHPSSPERDRAEDLFATRYIPFLLMGLSNTPVFDYDTFKIDPEAKAAQQRAIADHPGTVTARLTQEFLDLMNKTGGAVYKKGSGGEQIDIPEVKSFYDGLENHARELLNEANPNK
ncbi:hypothetical protein [Cohnella sp. JJ-181]|uniref:hypothetical protein n=1 Tax=Cohnella rhizoplanae TaxID=2974897 RepID=UPI0022FFAB29|nr:hypothetical protein [Cohnella sp. JJ-181]CAI6078887.1 hypothetical protein COHCIP112018_02694 [Cohnella sp. JJ-181]